jgi:hypothetical protein
MFNLKNDFMKKSKAFMIAAFLFAIGGAYATKALANNKPFTLRYQIVGDECQSFNTSECDGPNTHTVCTNVFATDVPNCSIDTYRTN